MSPQNSSETVTNEYDKEIPKENYIPPEKREKVIHDLNDTNQPSKFRVRNWVKIKDDIHGTCGTGNLITFNTSMTRSSLCNYSDAYIHVKQTITIPNTAAALVVANNANKKALFKNCAPFTKCISKINNTQVDRDIYSFMTIL